MPDSLIPGTGVSLETNDQLCCLHVKCYPWMDLDIHTQSHLFNAVSRLPLVRREGVVLSGGGVEGHLVHSKTCFVYDENPVIKRESTMTMLQYLYWGCDTRQCPPTPGAPQMQMRRTEWRASLLQHEGIQRQFKGFECNYHCS